MSANFDDRHLVMDCEAIGTDASKCPTLEWSYVWVDWARFVERPYSFEELLDTVVKNKMDLRDQVENHGCSYGQENLDWWLSKKDMRYILKPTPEDLTVQEFFSSFIRYLQPKGPSYWWTRSNTYDPIILWRLARSAGREAELNQYLAYWRVRDIRSFIDAKLDFPKENGFVPVADQAWWIANFRQHDSRHDVAADVLRLQAIKRAEADVGQVPR